MNLTNTWRCRGGEQRVYIHASSSTKTDMTFSVFLPKADKPVPVLWFLSGLTCTWENVTTKGHFQRAAAEHQIAIVCPDTSPRGDDVPDDDAWDFAKGAGFYVDATEAPWAANYNMWTYVAEELPALVFDQLPLNKTRQGITGHSMGGHGALTLGLTYGERYKFVSAFAPICNPSSVPWGQKALGNYLGKDPAAWRAHDAVALLEDGNCCAPLLVDQGAADNFLEEQLRPESLKAACADAGQALELRVHEGYDHSYYFVSSFLDEHVARFAAALT